MSPRTLPNGGQAARTISGVKEAENNILPFPIHLGNTDKSKVQISWKALYLSEPQSHSTHQP